MVHYMGYPPICMRRTIRNLRMERGNACVRAKDYEGAEAEYTIGIENGTSESSINDIAIMYSNRSYCRMKLNKVEEALDDAKHCVRLRPTWAKGYYRLTVCMIHLEQVDNAYRSICIAYSLDPSSALLRDVKNGLREQVNPEELQSLEEEITLLLPKGVGGLSGLVMTEQGLQERTSKIPVTLLSGFLGAGKTTLLNHILNHNDAGLKVAVIVNDMSQVNIDAQLVKTESSTEAGDLIELTNGCICCTLRDDLLVEIARIADERPDVNYILIESTGISEPIPVAQTFLFEDIVGRSLSKVAALDTMVTVVDVSAFLENLESSENLRDRDWQSGEKDVRGISNLLLDQVEFSNVVILNKVDLVKDPHVIAQVRSIIGALNKDTVIIEASHGRVDVSRLVNTGLFDLNKASQSRAWLRELSSPHVPETEEYGISSWVFQCVEPLDMEALEKLMFQSHDFFYGQCNVVRSKGFFWIGQDPRVIVEWSIAGKQTTARVSGFWDTNPPRERKTQIVFIGINLDVGRIRELCAQLVYQGEPCRSVNPPKTVSKLHQAMIERGVLDATVLTSEDMNWVLSRHEELQSQAMDPGAQRFEVIRNRLLELQEKPDDLTNEEIQEISLLSEEYAQLATRYLEACDEHAVQHDLKALQEGIAAFSFSEEG